MVDRSDGDGLLVELGWWLVTAALFLLALFA